MCIHACAWYLFGECAEARGVRNIKVDEVTSSFGSGFLRLTLRGAARGSTVADVSMLSWKAGH